MSYWPNRFTAVIDTNVLLSNLSRNILLTLAEAGLYRPRWSQTTFEKEFELHFLRLRPGKEETFLCLQQAMERAFPEAFVVEDDEIVASLALPDADDRHVLAAAIQTSAGVIVTKNLKDFPSSILVRHNVEAKSDDDFISDCIDMSPLQSVSALRTMRERFKQPEVDPSGLLLRMEQIGLPQAAAVLAPFQKLL